MQPLKKQCIRLSHIVFLVSYVLFSLFLWNVDASSISHAQARIPSTTPTPTPTPSPSPISVNIAIPVPGVLHLAPDTVFVVVGASDTAAAITSVKLTDVPAPGPIDRPMSSTTSSITPINVARTQSHHVMTNISATPFTTPPPLPPCDDPLTIPCVATASPYAFRISFTQPGRHVLIATAFDSLGNTASASVYIPVTGTRPLATILTPAANATFTAPAQIILTASAFQFLGTISHVQYFDGTTLIGVATTAPYTVIWNNATVGTHVLMAQSDDTVGMGGTPSAPVTITVNPPGPPPCQIQYQVHQWPGGFTNNITITNTGTSTLTAWNMQFAFGGDQNITNLWNGSFTQSGQQVSIANLSYNGTIAPQGTTNLGFNGTWSSSNTSPTSFMLNGQSCTII